MMEIISLDCDFNRLFFFSPFPIQVSSFSGQAERAVPRSAALMAVFGIGVSSFSVKQMVNSSPRRF